MDTTADGRRRVVITGMGALTPLGALDEFWEGLAAGRSGVRRITQYDPQGCAVQVAAEVDFDPKEHIPPKEARRMSRASQMALVAGRKALADAGLTKEDLAGRGDRMATVIGTVNSGFPMLLDAAYDYTIRGRPPFPLALINGLPNMPAHYISGEMKAYGPQITLSTGCASGTDSIGEALHLIRAGRADLVFAGGADYLIRKEILAAFDAMGIVVSKYNDRPQEASRPFDADRSGFVMGDGAGVVVLETMESARQRGARIYAEVAGHACTADASHVAAPDSDGTGAVKAMRWAVEDACLNLEDIDYINAHGTGTRVNDAVETRAIRTLFGDHARRLAVSSTKSMIGHCMGAAGTFEAMAAVMAIYAGVIPPTINYTTPDPECDLDYVANEARQATVRAAISNSFGLGGQNACLVLRGV